MTSLWIKFSTYILIVSLNSIIFSQQSTHIFSTSGGVRVSYNFHQIDVFGDAISGLRVSPNYEGVDGFLSQSESCGLEDLDDCGVCYGNNSDMDDCGECFEDNSSCSGCMDENADNFDPDALIDNGTCVYSPSQISFGEFNSSSNEIEINLTNPQPVYGFQFNITSSPNNFIVNSVFGGISEDLGFQVNSGYSSDHNINIILGFHFEGISIPPGEHTLLYLNYSITSESEICIMDPIITGENYDYEVEIGDCLFIDPSTPGDVNNDGVINVVDVVQLVNEILIPGNENTGCLTCADLNGDGTINVVDVVLLVNIILGNDLTRYLPIHDSKLIFSDQSMRIKSDGDIAGIQLDVNGDFIITQSHLPFGWKLHNEDNTILMYSSTGESITENVLFEYDGELKILNSIIADWQGNSLSAQIRYVPSTFSLAPAYPNPFNPVTTIKFGVPDPIPAFPSTGEGEPSSLSYGGEGRGEVRIQIIDITGRLMTTLINESIEPGFHTVEWNAEGVPSGVYFVRMLARQGFSGGAADDYYASQKVLLLK